MPVHSALELREGKATHALVPPICGRQHDDDDSCQRHDTKEYGDDAEENAPESVRDLAC